MTEQELQAIRQRCADAPGPQWLDLCADPGLVRYVEQSTEDSKALLARVTELERERDSLRFPHDFGLNSSRTDGSRCAWCDQTYGEAKGTPCPQLMAWGIERQQHVG